MPRLHKIFLILLSSFIFCLFSTASAIHAEPFPPFSVEGNPDFDYYMGTLFYMNRYIGPGHFKIYENRDRSRDYQQLMLCPGEDFRDYDCTLLDGAEVDGCDGGDVNICHVEANQSAGYAYTATSGPVDCKGGKNAPEGVEVKGVCKYVQTPQVRSEIKGTDFSNENRSAQTPAAPAALSAPTTLSTPADLNAAGQPVSGLTYPKLQNEALHFGNQGNNNFLTWGSHFLSYNQCDRSIRQLLVVTRAAQTKKTLAETGEWPLGWVDWGYQTRNGKTLLQIREELPGGVSGAGLAIAEGVDDFFLNAGNLDAVSDISGPKKAACEQISQGILAKETWALDLAQAPLYSPSFRQGWVRGSICVWDLCCPGVRCPIDRDTGLVGNSRDLYYDISISQAFGAALDDLLLHYPLEQGSKIFRKLASANQLIRFLGSASTQAIPTVVIERLEKDMAADPCFKYHAIFEWFPMSYLFDYELGEVDFYDEEKKCPAYHLQPDLSKEKGGAFPESLLQRLVNLLWRGQDGRGSKKVDSVTPVKYHLLTIPDAMGQTISEIERHVYNTRDTLTVLESVKDHNQGISNIIDDNANFLYAGKSQPIAGSQRYLELLPCGSPEYSTHLTGIEAYAHGTRNGCYDDSASSTATCDGQAFGALISNTPYANPIDKAQTAFVGMQSLLTPELIKIYAEASDKTGVPCEVLAGIHFVEGDLNPNGSLVSGRSLGTNEPDAGGQTFGSLLDTAIYAGEHLKSKVGGNLNDVKTLITALSRYNGGGNSNCQLGYPWPIPYSGCPRAFEGEDDPYPVNWIDNKHSSMYLLYCADSTACEPQIWERPGALTFAVTMWQNITQNGAVAEEIADTPLVDQPITPASGTPATPFTPHTCSPQELDTALGCLPVSESLASTILSFVIGIAGAIALVVMLMGTIQIMTAAGDPEKVSRGKELFGGAVKGLLLIVFSVAFVRLIAGDIIRLPGF